MLAESGVFPVLRSLLGSASLALAFACLAVVGGCASEDKEAKAMFRHWVIDANPNTGEDCCTDVLMLGDIDGDGKRDVVIGAEHAKADGLVWYQYPTWEKRPVASGEFTTDGQLTDMDKDGDLDIAVGDYTQGREAIVWFENGLKQGNSEWKRHVIGPGYAHDMEVGDIDGDGDIDLVTCDKKKVLLWVQLAPGEFRQRVILETKGEGLKLTDVDRDGDLDIVFGASWLENPGSPGGVWKRHWISESWFSDTRVFVADMNADGRPDVVLSVSEGKGRISWFEAPENPRHGTWVEHGIELEILDGAHSLQVGDMNGDGKQDVLVAEMHTSRHKRVILYRNDGEAFTPIVLSTSGSHNMRVADMDGDGGYDIVGKNYAGPGRVVEMWENLVSKRGKWNYAPLDTGRPKSEQGKMGILFADVDGDGFKDIVAGSLLYKNPAGRIWETWRRVQLVNDLKELDVYFATDINGNRLADLVGIAGDTAWWLEAVDQKATSWRARPVAKVALGRTQGYAVAKLVPGDKPQLVFTRGKRHLYVLAIPSNPEHGPWPLHVISKEAEEEGVALGDIDGDGRLDIATVAADGEHAIWLENSGTFSVEWQSHAIGGTHPWMDRVALADINGDGRLDFVCTVERQDLVFADSVYWFEGGVDPKNGAWKRHLIARLRSTNSLDLADIDGDGGIDVVVAEHTDLKKSQGAPDNLTLVYRTTDGGRAWVPELVERGPHSSHLGARAVDLDNDGVKEILSLGWNQYQTLHLWSKTAKPVAQ